MYPIYPIVQLIWRWLTFLVIAIEITQYANAAVTKVAKSICRQTNSSCEVLPILIGKIYACIAETCGLKTEVETAKQHVHDLCAYLASDEVSPLDCSFWKPVPPAYSVICVVKELSPIVIFTFIIEHLIHHVVTSRVDPQLFEALDQEH